MPSFIEFEGKDIENVTQKASKKLNIPPEKLKYEVISFGSTGIFGLVGTKKARIRVTLPKPDIKTANRKSPAKLSEDGTLKKDRHTPARINADMDTVQSGGDPAKEPVKVGEQILQRIVDAITTDATISVETDPERVLYNVKGGNTAILIGKRGQTLEAMQYLVDIIVNRGNHHRIRARVDIEGYLENRKNSLEQLAGRLAEKVKRTGKPASVGQMNAHDRRIVHIALKDDNDVRTQSVGEGLYRKLVIFPRKTVPKKKSNKT